MKILITTLILLLTNTMYAQKVKFKTITINPQLSFQNYEHFKRLTLSSPDSEAEYIDGFEFLWGYTYKLRAKEIRLNSNLSDGTRYNYSLEKIISKTKAADTTQFNLFLDGSRYYYQVDSTEQVLNNTFRQINDTTFSYFDKVEIQVPAYLTNEFRFIVEGKASKLGTFVYVDEKRIRLIKL
jgi:hypothetical protein